MTSVLNRLRGLADARSAELADRPTSRQPVKAAACTAADAAVERARARYDQARKATQEKVRELAERQEAATHAQDQVENMLKAGVSDVDRIVTAETKASTAKRAAALAPGAVDAARRTEDAARYALQTAELTAGHIHRSGLVAEIDPLLEQIAALADQIQAAVDARPTLASAHTVYDTVPGSLEVLVALSRLRQHLTEDWPKERAKAHEVAARDAASLPTHP